MFIAKPLILFLSHINTDYGKKCLHLSFAYEIESLFAAVQIDQKEIMVFCSVFV